MKIIKKINGFSIDVNDSEYDVLIDAIRKGALWEGMQDKCNPEKYIVLRKELESARGRFLTDEEAAPLVNCLCCKNCLPPVERENEKMCKLKECKFVKA